ncbi:hypothetical protein Clacol_000082 [Clathrus columnatus]|uniref:Coatomer subunit beta' n=1 Tax=Clathrus columnatus TaxID=1419009 RepID=A0AAV4ZWL1_9AGAM|nr:hypothetical protein Clacol_000082 [Clathrus columnatus]
MLLDVNRKLLSRSDRVKSVDFHPAEPWLLTGLFNGSVNIYNLETGAIVKTFEVATIPVRCVRFIARKNWFVAGSDDYQLRILNYNTHEKVAAFEAHLDYIRCLTVHPTASIVLTGSDDMSIKAWDWDKQWKCVQVFEGHTHFIMNLAFNLKDTNTFASSCLDRSVKFWSLNSGTAHSSLEAHDKGVNYVEFYPGADKPYLVTVGADNLSIKIWDYFSKSCVQTMEGHTGNVSFAVFHPNLPVLISGGDDGTVRIWNTDTYRLENTLNYGLERAWCVSMRKGSNDVAVGFDEGVVVVKIGREEPSFSMDHSGKLVYTRNTEVLLADLRALEDATTEGTPIPVSGREIGSTELFASSLHHSPNGRFITFVGDGEYIIYTASSFRNRSFGTGTSFAWASDSNTYAVLEGKTKIKVYNKFFKERGGSGFKGADTFIVESLHGGPLLSAKGNGFVIFWDWESCDIVRRIEIDAKIIIWSSNGDLVAITSTDSFYVLRYDEDAYRARVESGTEIGDEGVEEAFDVVAEISETVATSKWFGDCFIYTNSANRLNYLIGTQTTTVTHLHTSLFLLGYIPAQNRLYLTDKTMNIYSYSFAVAVIEYEAAILQNDLQTAAEILPSIPNEYRSKIARFLETQGLKELAIEITTDLNHKFDLLLQLDDLDRALEIARSDPSPENEAKWKAIGDRALATWRFDLARECFENAGDLSALLLLLLAIGDRTSLHSLGQKALQEGQENIAFTTLLQLGDADACVELLLKTKRFAEAALFARTYAPSQIPQTIAAWKQDLASGGKANLAAAIANPIENPDLFEED